MQVVSQCALRTQCIALSQDSVHSASVLVMHSVHSACQILCFSVPTDSALCTVCVVAGFCFLAHAHTHAMKLGNPNEGA